MALTVSIGAECVAGADMSAAQMACCAGTDHECGTVMTTADCCLNETAVPETLAATIQQVVVPPAPLSRALAHLIDPPDTHVARVRAVDHVRHVAESPPKYVLLATFLI